MNPGSPSTSLKGSRAPAGLGRVLLLALYYALILLGAIVVHATNSFATPSFVYQGF